MRILMMPALLLGLLLGGCVTTNQSVLVGGLSLTASVKNPVRSVDIYRVKNVYAATLELAVQYRAYCWSKPYVDLMKDAIAAPVCKNRRPAVRQIQSADAKAYAAIKAAEKFVRDNPTLSAVSIIGAAWTAVTDFQSKVPVTGR